MDIASVSAYLQAQGGVTYCLLTGLLNFFIQNVEYSGSRAVIIHPVVDMSSSYPLCYQPPIAGQEVSCRRANQGLYNELVECQCIVGTAVRINYDRVVYGHDADSNPYSTMWMDMNGLKLVQQLDPFLVSMIPDKEKKQQLKLLLQCPWEQYSVGTYFVRSPVQDTDDAYAVYIPHFNEHTYVIETIPKEHCLLVEKRTMEQARNLFVELLFKLINCAQQMHHNGVVPYVWGGCSFVTANDQHDFIHDQGCWHRPCAQEVYAGYDCSGLVWRLAQCAGIPFLWKVTKIMHEFCRGVAPDDPLQEGDIIWFAGHAMIVADTQNNMLIEAAGYKAGFGCVHCVKLEERFEGIQTYDDLIDAYYNNCPIGLLNSSGQVTQQVLVKLLKLTPPYAR